MKKPNDMTLDERAIRRCVRFMRKQGKPSMLDEDCVNVAPDGSRCAIGCFFQPRFAKSVDNSMLREQLIRDGVSSAVVIGLLGAHDHASTCKALGFLQAFETMVWKLAETSGCRYLVKDWS
jgi:hypothetical protein